MEIMLSLRIALRALRVNKMRSFLTMLGIIIGIGAVIVMIAIGTGASRLIADQIASMGSNLILILPGATTSGGLRSGAGGAATLTLDDVKALRSECPSIEYVAPMVRGAVQTVYTNMNWSTIAQGVTPEFLDVREWGMAAGRGMMQSDVDAAAKVCLIGATVADNLFGGENPIDKTVRIKKVPFTVVGVLDRKGQSPQGTDQDDVLLIPLSTAQQKILGTQFPNSVGSILLKAKSLEELSRAEEEAMGLLDQRHRINPPLKERDFTVRNLSEILAVSQQSSQVMSLLLGSVASISLIVGGIGIMNIMLVSVTERTREIGIRMALGAKERDILWQFLTEAVLLTMFGGAIGILSGVAGAMAVSTLFGWPTFISTEAIGIAVFFSSLIGIFFGFYPARKAASLNPIDALRYE